MNKFEKSLENLGFTKKTSLVYLSLLEIGEATASDIAKKAGIKRTTVYNILPELLDAGLIEKTIKNHKKMFFVDDPSLLKHYLDEKCKTIEEIIPELKAIQNILPYKPKVTFYEGLGGAKKLYNDTINYLNSGDEILSYTGLSDFYKLFPKNMEESYIKKRVAKKIRVKIITFPSETAQLWKDNAEKELREIRISPDSYQPFNADTEIYKDRVAIISYKENFMAVVIESKDIANMQKYIFNLAWQGIKT